MAKEEESRPERVKAMQLFLHDAYTDYIAARVLLLRGLLKQAAVLSSSSIEKCAKALLVWRGKPTHRHHLRASHWEALANEENFGDKLNRDFVALNESVYRVRYSDSLPVGFNMVIASREFLAELDQTLLTVLSCFKFDQGGSWRASGYEAGIKNQDENLLTENHLISRDQLQSFIHSKPQFVYEVRRYPVHLAEAMYMTDRPAKTPGFKRQGFAPIDATTGLFDISHFPMRGTFLLLRDGLEQISREDRPNE
jgi:HEPN domain-containing protein